MTLDGIPEVLKAAATGLRRVPVFLFVLAVCCALGGVVIGTAGQAPQIVIVFIIAAGVLTITALAAWLVSRRRVPHKIRQDIAASRKGSVNAEDAQVADSS